MFRRHKCGVVKSAVGLVSLRKCLVSEVVALLLLLTFVTIIVGRMYGQHGYLLRSVGSVPRDVILT